MKRFRHYLAHLFGTYTGKVETFWEGGFLMVAFKCDECGVLTQPERVPDHIVYPERRLSR